MPTTKETTSPDTRDAAPNPSTSLPNISESDLPLTAVEEVRRDELEQIIERGIETVFQVGAALREIKESKLYRATHDTFEAYLADRCQMSRPRGYQLIEAARVSTTVDKAGLPPIQNERQARELSGLNDPQVLDAWQKATTESTKPTAAIVRAAVEPIKPRRNPLPDQITSKLHEIDRATAHLEKLLTDDRFKSHRSQIAETHQHDLVRAIRRLLGAYLAFTDPLWTGHTTTAAFEVAILACRNDGDLSAENLARHLGDTP